MAKGIGLHMSMSTTVETYKTYIAAIAASFAEYGGKFPCARQSQPSPKPRRARTLVIEFPNYERALACYESEGYQTAKALRDRSRPAIL